MPIFIDFSGKGRALITAWLEVRVLPGPPQNKINDLAGTLATLATAISDSLGPWQTCWRDLHVLMSTPLVQNLGHRGNFQYYVLRQSHKGNIMTTYQKSVSASVNQTVDVFTTVIRVSTRDELASALKQHDVPIAIWIGKITLQQEIILTPPGR